ncbi:MAG TPA: phosphatase PAP2 family protein [Verrucomicrobiae bacterium]|nr:phosphatase PAP2 family protein [Verrucomicrobiae bacterium]
MPRNIIGCFKGRRLWWHLLAIALTAALVLSGFDWNWFVATRGVVAHRWWFPALFIGMFLPVLLPLALIVGGFSLSRPGISRLGWALGQSALVGWLISSAYKFFTGRVHPAHAVGADLSRQFRFGLYRGGIFWGWPSSHTTVAFAMAVTALTLFPRRRLVRFVCLLYAFYIGISVSMTIHWCSDFAAGAIIGSVAGAVVGRSFATAQAV